MSRIIVGMSGGVDSAVAASILVDKGYEVEGIFMKNWEEESEFCSAEKDYKDALQVCDILGIKIHSINFAKEYWERVFEHFLEEYKNGRTPNPDILCNTEIKFKEFLHYSKDLGADVIATGHYARIYHNNHEVLLKKGSDLEKDQSYFLHGLNQNQISSAISQLETLKNLKFANKQKNLGLITIIKKTA